MSFFQRLKNKWSGMSTGGKIATVGVSLAAIGAAILAGRNGRAKKFAELVSEKARGAYDEGKPKALELIKKAQDQIEIARRKID
jgi:hypothetical protein